MTVWSTDQNRQFDRGRLLWFNSFFSEEKCFACILSLFLFPLVFFFVYCLSIVFSGFAAEAGMKGEMSHFLDAPDA